MTAGHPLVTIGCAVYNGEATLERALRPLVEQDYANLEILIADDASTDRSPEICAAFAREDARVRVIRQPANIGLTRNFNFLFREARGAYFMWADQDDIRDRTFVRKAVAALEADPAAVLCHCHTGAFIGDPADVRYVVTLDGVAGVDGALARYRAFLRRYSDTTVYGLIRTTALQRTHLWRDALGSANALLFELLLQGRFLQVPETLYWYSGRGLGRRPTPAQEYARMNLGPMPWYYFPFLVLAANQAADIWASRHPLWRRIALVGILIGHVTLVATTKLLYRALDRLAPGRLPRAFTVACSQIAACEPHMIFAGRRDESLFPPAHALRGGR